MGNGEQTIEEMKEAEAEAQRAYEGARDLLRDASQKVADALARADGLAVGTRVQTHPRAVRGRHMEITGVRRRDWGSQGYELFGRQVKKDGSLGVDERRIFDRFDVLGQDEL